MIFQSYFNPLSQKIHQLASEGHKGQNAKSSLPIVVIAGDIKECRQKISNNFFSRKFINVGTFLQSPFKNFSENGSDKFGGKLFLLRVIHSTHYFALLQEIVAQAGDNIAEAAHVPHFVMKQNFRKPLDDIFIIGCVITGMKTAEKQKPIFDE